VTTTGGLADGDRIVIYGRDTCPDTQRARRHLDLVGVEYRYVNLDLDEAARERVESAGYQATPVVVTPDGQVFVEPSDERLAELAGERRPGGQAPVEGGMDDTNRSDEDQPQGLGETPGGTPPAEPAAAGVPAEPSPGTPTTPPEPPAQPPSYPPPAPPAAEVPPPTPAATAPAPVPPPPAQQPRRRTWPRTLSRLVSFLFGILQALLFLRILLLLLIANPDNEIVAAILTVTDPFVEPFRDMFQLDEITGQRGAILDLAAVVAFIAWTLVEALILALLRLFGRSPSRT